MPKTLELPKMNLAAADSRYYVGWHFIKEFLDCPYKWYAQRLAPRGDGSGNGFCPRYSSEAAYVGQLFHAGLEGWLKSGWKDGKFDLDAGIAAIVAHGETTQESVGSFEGVHAGCVADAESLLKRHHKWAGPGGPDPDWELYRICSDEKGEPLIEREWEIDLGYNNYWYKTRIDAVGHRCSDGILSAVETKTCDASRAAMDRRAKSMDPQLTSEQYALALTWPGTEPGVVLNHIIKRAAAAKAPRYFEVQDRNEWRLQQFRVMMVQTLQKIDAAVEEYKALMDRGVDEPEAARLAFPNLIPGERCVSFGSTCTFYPLCEQGGDLELVSHLTKTKYELETDE